MHLLEHVARQHAGDGADPVRGQVVLGPVEVVRRRRQPVRRGGGRGHRANLRRSSARSWRGPPAAVDAEGQRQGVTSTRRLRRSTPAHHPVGARGDEPTLINALTESRGPAPSGVAAWGRRNSEAAADRRPSTARNSSVASPCGGDVALEGIRRLDMALAAARVVRRAPSPRQKVALAGGRRPGRGQLVEGACVCVAPRASSPRTRLRTGECVTSPKSHSPVNIEQHARRSDHGHHVRKCR